MNPLRYFDRVFCLNLDERQDRWAECSDNFQNYNIDNYERFPAIRIANGAYEHWSQKRIGQVSCLLSFCKMIDEAINRNYNSVIFLEDDFEFCLPPEELSSKIEQCLKELPKNWDMFYLGANVINEILEKPLDFYSENLLKLNSGYALHSVAISRAGLINIKSYFENGDKPWYQQMIEQYEAIDVFFAKTYQPNQRCYIPNELLALQRPDFSSIEGSFFNYSNLMIDRFNHFKNTI